MKYKFNVINRFGAQEPWSGVFKSKEDADKWYNKHGREHERRGHKLILVKCSNNE
jgi:hypothetical protein